MSDLISRSALKLEVFNMCNCFDGVQQLIDEAPAADAVEVIRCGRCAYYGKSPFGSRELGWCRIDAKHRPPNYYCANADEAKKRLSADRMEDESK